MPFYKPLILPAFFVLFLSGNAMAQFEGTPETGSFSNALEESRFLRVTEAFIPSLRWNQDKQAQLEWYIEPDYYLYRARFVYQNDSSGEIAAAYPLGVTKFDEFFQEDLEVYYNNLQIQLEIPENTKQLYVQFQGCAEAGLCYPPTWVGFEVDIATGSAGYLGEMPLGPPIPTNFATSGNMVTATQAVAEEPFPITLLIGFLSGLLLLAGIVLFAFKKGQ